MHFGKALSLEITGASHTPELSLTLSGIPAGERIDLDMLQAFLRRRASDGSALTTARREADIPAFLSGLADGVTDGSPIIAVLTNTDVRSGDYDLFSRYPRPSHADYTALCKYGKDADLAGGGRFSGRMTAPLCVAGGIALQVLQKRGISVGAHLLSVGTVCDTPFDPCAPALDALRTRAFPTLSEAAEAQMRAEILAAAEDGDSVGGMVECAAVGLPAGLGGPLFEGLESLLSAALFAIPAVRGVDFGAGFASAVLRGSRNNDPFCIENGKVRTRTNKSGGIQGGITNGMPLLCRAAFKPTPTIAKEQDTVDLLTMTDAKLSAPGRHDPCAALRAVPAVEAAVALCLLGLILEAENGT